MDPACGGGGQVRGWRRRSGRRSRSAGRVAGHAPLDRPRSARRAERRRESPRRSLRCAVVRSAVAAALRRRLQPGTRPHRGVQHSSGETQYVLGASQGDGPARRAGRQLARSSTSTRRRRNAARWPAGVSRPSTSVISAVICWGAPCIRGLASPAARRAPHAGGSPPGRGEPRARPTSTSSTAALAESARVSAGVLDRDGRQQRRPPATRRARPTRRRRRSGGAGRRSRRERGTAAARRARRSACRRRTPSGPGRARARARAPNSVSYQCTRQCSSTSGRPAPWVSARCSTGSRGAVLQAPSERLECGDRAPEVVARHEHVDVAREAHARSRRAGCGRAAGP